MKKAVTPKESADTGMAAVLICLLIGYFGGQGPWLAAAIVLMVATMAAPNLFWPAAVVWFGFSRLLGAVVSRVLLTLLFVGLVAPVGLIRRTAGADPMKRKAWKNGSASVFETVERRYGRADLEKPY